MVSRLQGSSAGVHQQWGGELGHLGRRHRAARQGPAPRLGGTERHCPRGVLPEQSVVPGPVHMPTLAGLEEAPERRDTQYERRALDTAHGQ